MKRVASLFLPHWSIDRVRRAERRHAPPPDAPVPDPLPSEAAGGAPRNTGWRPGARWARAEIAALPAHQRQPLRELGRRSEAAAMPFKRLPGDDGGKSSGWVELRDGRASPAPAAPPERARPEPDRRLLVTVHRIGSRVEIAAASPAAQAIGIAPGMALTQARAMAPGLDVRDADAARDRADLERLAIALARRWCPVVAISDDDGLLLDLTGVAHLHGGEAAMARRILAVLARLGFAARIAVADTAGAAWALARHAGADGDGVTICERGCHDAALAPLPAAALRLDGSAIGLLARLGIATIGDLLALPRAPLVRRFGAIVARRIDQATGAAGEPLDPVVPPERIMVERRFAEPIATAEAIHHWLGGLVEELTGELATAGQGARALLFVAERVDASAQAIRIGLARPTRDSAHLLRLIARRIEEIDPGYGIDALALHVRRADPLGPQAFGAALAGEQMPDLAPLVDTLANRIGAARLWRQTPVESDVPERAATAIDPLDKAVMAGPRLRHDDVRLLDARVPDHPWHARWPRPARLLQRPERIDHVLADLPDQPPRRFTWRGCRHTIVHADGPERITGEWWRRSGERDAVRDYFQVEDETGRRFWLYRRGDGLRPETGDLTWYMHGAFG